MTVLRAQVTGDYIYGGGITYRIALMDQDQDGRPIRTVRLLRRPEDGGPFFEWYAPTDEERMGAVSRDDRSLFHLPEGCGEALLEALTRHFHGLGPDAAIHQQLSHEQRRRDTLEDAVLGLANRFADVALFRQEVRNVRPL